jgi:hypothetical protein
MGPSGLLEDGSALVVYDASNAVHAVRRNRDRFGPPETIASPGLYPSLATRGRRAVAAWLDPGRNRLRVARLVN